MPSTERSRRLPGRIRSTHCDSAICLPLLLRVVRWRRLHRRASIIARVRWQATCLPVSARTTSNALPSPPATMFRGISDHYSSSTQPSDHSTRVP
jgi:hypothetical protein